MATQQTRTLGRVLIAPAVGLLFVWMIVPLAMTIYFSYDPDATGAASLLTSIRWGRLFRQVH